MPFPFWSHFMPVTPPPDDGTGPDITDAEVRLFAEAMERPPPAQPREPRREWERRSAESWEAWLRRSAHQIAPLLGGDDE